MSQDNCILENREKIKVRRKQTQETKDKISKKHKGKKLSEETKLRIAASHRGKKLTQETKDKISKRSKGKIISEETRKKLSLSCKGRKLSESTKLKISKGNRGRIVSTETRELIRQKMIDDKRTKLVMVDNVLFKSIRETAKYFKVSENCVRKRCNSLNFYGWSFVN